MGKCFKGEDSPATIPLIVSSLSQCNKVIKIIPFLSPKKGVMATIYGMTALDLKRLEDLQLKEYVEETKKYVGKEELIAPYPFD